MYPTHFWHSDEPLNTDTCKPRILPNERGKHSDHECHNGRCDQRHGNGE